MKAFFISLGCPKNLCDTEVLMGKLAASGCEITTSEKEADIIVVNTCAFLESARKESLETIEEMKKLGKKVYVAGCLPKMWGHEETRGGTREDVEEIESIGLFDYKTPRIKATPPWTAYVKIAEGCNNKCTYCLIPMIRGGLRIRKVQDILKEVEVLADRGVKEVIFIAQDTTAHFELPRILKAAARIKGIHWIRIMYAHPSHINERLIKVMAEEKKICAYLDLPLQHACAKILKGMNRPRPWGHEILDLINKIRHSVPGIAIRTSIMVGFPEETDTDFEYLLNFVEKTGFERLGGFVYSRENGTPAAKLRGQVPAIVANQRFDSLMKLQNLISKERNKKLIGTTFEVLVERIEDGLLYGRTYMDAPEIDCSVVIKTRSRIRAGSFVKAKITGSSAYDLSALLVT
ncbi:MAG: MiaB/RimO family radical SAM methylthiotransferase [Gammaproteobacteria bacterium]|nr:MiaB/RimO family radical SAM methylthiotransferase [Gammaproteobacteria bacterium]